MAAIPAQAKSKKKTQAKRAPVKKAAAKKTTKTAPVFRSTGFWLLKSEPDCYSIDHLKAEGQTIWSGVRNYQARNFMMHSMQAGDRFLFYHSSAEPAGVVGWGEIVRPHQPDVTALDPKDDHYDPKASTDHPIWFGAEVKFKHKFPRIVTLQEIRATNSLAKMPLLAPGQRLSVQPVAEAEFKKILEIAKA